MSRSSTMHGVGRTSLVMSRKSRRAMRVSNSEYGKLEKPVLAARPLTAVRNPAPEAKNARLEFMEPPLRIDCTQLQGVNGRYPRFRSCHRLRDGVKLEIRSIAASTTIAQLPC